MLVEQRTSFVELPRAPSCVAMSAGMLVRCVQECCARVSAGMLGQCVQECFGRVSAGGVVQCVQECCARVSAGMLVRRVDDAWRTTNTGALDDSYFIMSGAQSQWQTSHNDCAAKALHSPLPKVLYAALNASSGRQSGTGYGILFQFKS